MIDVSTKRHPNAKMLCDIEDFEVWRDDTTLGRIHASQSSGVTYPCACLHQNAENTKTLQFHRLVRPDLDIIDHINRNGLDNRKQNLRDGSGGINNWNTNKRADNKSGCRGVNLHKASGKFVAQIVLNGKKRHLGLFKSAHEASARYELASKRRDQGFALNEL